MRTTSVKVNSIRTSLGLSVLVLLCGCVASSAPAEIGKTREPLGGHKWAAKVGSVWQEVRIQGFSPFPRDNLAATRGIDFAIPSGYLFGGGVDHFKQGPTFFNTLFEWKIAGPDEDPVITFTKLAEHSTARPSVRAFPAVGTVRNGSHGQLYVFGGGTYDRFMTLTTAPDIFWRYDVGTGRWNDLSHLGGPSPRSGALMIVWNDDLFVFGGVSETADDSVPYVMHNDLWRFDTEQMIWSLLSNDMGPKKKHKAVGGIVGKDRDKKLLIYGGERFDASNFAFPIDRETWMWDIADGVWTRKADGPAPNDNLLGTNASGALAFGGDEQGGFSGCGAPFYQNATSDLFYYDLARDTWTRMASVADVPSAVKRGAGFWMTGYLYVFGGFNFVCNSEEDPGQVWNEHVYRIKFEE